MDDDCGAVQCDPCPAGLYCGDSASAPNACDDECVPNTNASAAQWCASQHVVSDGKYGYVGNCARPRDERGNPIDLAARCARSGSYLCCG